MEHKHEAKYETDTEADDGYEGPVEIIADDVIVSVQATLTGHFDPLSGRYSWYGRLAADPLVAQLAQAGQYRVQLRTPAGQVATALSDVDPWGRYRVSGSGTPPFEVA